MEADRSFDGGLGFVPMGHLLVGVGGAQEGRFGEVRGEELFSMLLVVVFECNGVWQTGEAWDVGCVG